MLMNICSKEKLVEILNSFINYIVFKKITLIFNFTMAQFHHLIDSFSYPNPASMYSTISSVI